ncbi:MAG: hypothetical protein AAF721_36765 [Myxococcota bacterium]
MRSPRHHCFVAVAGIATALTLTACDRDVGVAHYIERTFPDGTVMEPEGGCILATKGDAESVGGGGGGPDYAMEVSASDGAVHYRFYIAEEEDLGSPVAPESGELAAEIDAEMEFFESGETKHVEFETYDEIKFEVFLWGMDDCNSWAGERPDNAPEAQ